MALDAVDVNNQKTYTVAVCDPMTEWTSWLPPQVLFPSIPRTPEGGAKEERGGIRAHKAKSAGTKWGPKRV